jgi:hypothetical protein
MKSLNVRKTPSALIKQKTAVIIRDFRFNYVVIFGTRKVGYRGIELINNKFMLSDNYVHYKNVKGRKIARLSRHTFNLVGKIKRLPDRTIKPKSWSDAFWFNVCFKKDFGASLGINYGKNKEVQ